jgi:hypothetical protein
MTLIVARRRMLLPPFNVCVSHYHMLQTSKLDSMRSTRGKSDFCDGRIQAKYDGYLFRKCDSDCVLIGWARHGVLFFILVADSRPSPGRQGGDTVTPEEEDG